MKKSKWIVSLLAFAIVSVMCVQFAGYNAERKYTTVSKGFSIPVGNYILLMRDLDADGDGKDDKIYVYGEKNNEETEYAEKINMALVYAKNGFVKKTNVSWLKGYVSDIEVQDFTKNKNKDILLKVFSDEQKSVLTGFVVDFGYEIPKTVFRGSAGVSLSFSFADGFIVNCSLLDGKQFSVNLENKKDILKEKGIFDESGKFLGKEKVYAKPFFELSAKDDDSDGTGELKGSQKVISSVSETELFIIDTVQKYINDRWNVTKIEVRY